ncbi:MAG TPA: hypothetical protein DCE11_02845 [Ruminiclostridium sp.]|jgi:hypothetical protein|nr:PilZ domain-containing protein [Clostridiaceae bacterium]HAA25047.1 hypothetical protein [Ruminiclostridium sp.]
MKKEIRLEKIIPEYSTIEIKQKDQNVWVKSIVLNVHGKFIEVKQIEQFLSSAVMAGDTLQCMVIDEKNIYLMDSTVYNIKLITGSIVLEVHDLKTLANERKHKRYNALLSATFHEAGKLKEYYSVVLNISLSGLCIITNCELKQGDIIEVSINNPDTTLIYLQCVVKWSVDQGQKKLYGLSIEDIDEKNKFLLTDLIDKLEMFEKNQIKQLMESKPEYIF